MINPIKIDTWNDQVLKLDGYSFFHCREWAQVLFESYGYEPLSFSIFENDKLTAVLPMMLIKSWLTGKRVVSLPFSDHCDPLLKSFQQSDLLTKEAIRFCNDKKMNYIEFRSSSTKFPFEAQEFRTDLRHVLELKKSEKELFDNVSENTKRNIKKAYKQQLSLKINNDYSGIQIFYQMFCKTRKRHGLPPQPFVFFESIYKNIISKGKGDIIFSVKDSTCIAGAIYFKFGKKILYKFGASITDNNNLKGNFFVMWEAIKKYLSEGFEEIDFGRTEINHKGLQRFKRGWNTDEFFIYISRYSVKGKKYLSSSTNTSGIHNYIFNHTPIFLLKLIGNSLYKHIG